jgi:hypothetical protein
MTGTAVQQTDGDEAAREAGTEEPLRCFACRRLWPRTAMRWVLRPAGPVWFPPTVRVLRCPECVPG